MVLLLPFINGVGNAYSDRWGGVANLYQEVHEIVQSAAHLSICMRWSPSIFHLDWASPGTTWDPEQKELHQDVWERSRLQAEELDQQQRPVQPAPGEIYDPSKWITRVKISVTPSVKRSTGPLGDKRELVGQEEYILTQQNVVYYYGLLKDDDNRLSMLPLRRWIEVAHLAPRRRRATWGRVLAAIFLVWIVLLPYLTVTLVSRTCGSEGELPCGLLILGIVSTWSKSYLDVVDKCGVCWAARRWLS